jgi:predicted dehydrogenase
MPRVGFLGVGWIGRNRLEVLARSGLVEIAGVADPDTENSRAASEIAGCEVLESLSALLDAEIDGLIIATPSALHAEQAIAALHRGVAVFCQKPLARTAVDLSYRFVDGARVIRELIRAGELGTIYGADLVFHNAYGPDKRWFYDPVLSGGGCVIDLGSHLVDLALWTLEPDVIVGVSSRLLAKGEPLLGRTDVVEDYAVAQLDLLGGGVLRLACSWNLPAGRDAVIEASFYGTEGGATLRNVGGSFYDFTAERFRGTTHECLSTPPDDWGGRAALDWAQRLSANEGFDPGAERFIELAAAIDRLYGRVI